MNFIIAWYTYPTETYSVVELVNVEMFYHLYNSLKQTKVQKYKLAFLIVKKFIQGVKKFFS